MVNKVRVNIAGTPYAIATTDPEKYILSLAKKLDEDITKLLDDNANLSVTKAAVFCAMDYLDEYRKSTGSHFFWIYPPGSHFPRKTLHIRHPGYVATYFVGLIRLGKKILDRALTGMY